MDILFNKKIIKTIDNVDDLESFLIENKLYKHFKCFPEDKKNIILGEIKKTIKINYKQIKPWLREILKYPETIYKYDFLHSMGWHDKEIDEFISSKQKINSSILSKNKRDNPEKYHELTPKRIEYWIKKGFSKEDAMIKLSENQTTFSKKICIEKYGHDLGIEIFNQRQKKWIESLKKSKPFLDGNVNHNSFDYNKKSSVDLINRTSFLEKTKAVILSSIESNTIDEFIDKVLSKIDTKSFNDIHPYIKSKIVQNHYKTNYETIKDKFLEKCFGELSKNKFGTPVYHNKIRYRSVKEYKIALLLEKNEVKFLYEYPYPNSRFKSDFYLPEKNVYIEYFGLLDGKNFENLHEIQEHYFNKMNEKKIFCQNNNIRLISDTDFNTLYKKINEII